MGFDEVSITNPNLKVVILGTGLRGTAIAKRIRTYSKHEVVVGRRSATSSSNRSDDEGIIAAVKDADIVVLAFQASAHAKLSLNIWRQLKPDTIVIDVANTPPSQISHSHTVSTVNEVRKQIPQHSHVVKAFNTITASNITPNSSADSIPTVPFAADSPIATEKVSHLIRSMRMLPVHFGGLDTALDLEKSAYRLLPTWRRPISVSLIIWAWWIFYTTLSLYVIPGKNGYPPEEWETYPYFTFMASTGETAITLFAITILPGPITTLMQLSRKSTTKPLNYFMASWMEMRKELSISAFVFLIAHALSGSVAYDPTIDESKGQMYAAFGIIAFIMFGILAVFGNKTIVSDVGWADFQTVFSWVGVCGLIFGVLHQGFWAAEFLQEHSNPRFWPGNGIIMPRYWLGIIIPIFTIIVRLVSWSPCIFLPIRRMRGDSTETLPISKLELHV